MPFQLNIVNNVMEWRDTATNLLSAPGTTGANFVPMYARGTNVTASSLGNMVYDRLDSSVYVLNATIHVNRTTFTDVWVCSVAGTSAASAPTFATTPTIGATQVDGTVTWQFRGKVDHVANVDVFSERWVSGYKHVPADIVTANFTVVVRRSDGTLKRTERYYNGELHSCKIPAVTTYDTDGSTVLSEEFWLSGVRIDRRAVDLAAFLAEAGLYIQRQLPGEFDGLYLGDNNDEKRAYDVISPLLNSTVAL